MNRRHFLLSAGALATIVALPALAASPPTELQVFKSPTCGCCGAWVEHMRAAGFTVMAQYMSGMGHGIAPEGLRLALYFLREQLGYED